MHQAGGPSWVCTVTTQLAGAQFACISILTSPCCKHAHLCNVPSGLQLLPEPAPSSAPPAPLQQVLIQQLLYQPQQAGKLWAGGCLGQKGLHGCPGLKPLQVLVPEGGGGQQVQQLVLKGLGGVYDWL